MTYRAFFGVKYLGQGPADTGDVSSTVDFHDLRAKARFGLLYSDGSAYYVMYHVIHKSE